MAMSASAGDCVYDAVPPKVRASIGKSVLARRSKEPGDLDLLVRVTDDCAKRHRWSADGALHANGSAAMRFASEAIATKFGHPAWCASALTAIRTRPLDQIRNLSSTGAGDAEFELVLQQMVHTNPEIAAVLEGASNQALEEFILMIKLLAVSEVERLSI